MSIAASVASGNWARQSTNNVFLFHSFSDTVEYATVFLSRSSKLINTGMLKIYKNNTHAQSNAPMQTVELSERWQTHARSPAPV